ncbi:MAG: LamG domain-containing protein, partial [Planctomycetes bacterium]|nr:LamG domain-containing protein [Planctomycetota bacterium]
TAPESITLGQNGKFTEQQKPANKVAGRVEGKKVSPVGNYALEFDGIDDYLEIQASESLQIGRHFTIQMWIKPEFPETSDPDKRRGLLFKTGYVLGPPGEKGNRRAKSYGFGFTLTPRDNSKVELGILTCNDEVYGGSYLYSNKSGWQHMVMISSIHAGAAGRDVYHINTSQAGYEPAPYSNIIIGGKSSTPPTNLFKGQMAELRIWNRELSSDEIAKFKTTSLSGNEPGLVGCWTFEEAKGPSAVDISPFKNRAQLGSSYRAEESDPTWVRIGAGKENVSLKPNFRTDVEVESVDLPVRFITSDNNGKVERYHWRLDLTKPVRLARHSFKIEGDSIRGYWGSVDGILTSPENGTNIDYQLIIS